MDSQEEETPSNTPGGAEYHQHHLQMIENLLSDDEFDKPLFRGTPEKKLQHSQSLKSSEAKRPSIVPEANREETEEDEEF